MHDREMKLIYREPDKASVPGCLEIMFTIDGSIVFLGIILWRLL